MIRRIFIILLLALCLGLVNLAGEGHSKPTVDNGIYAVLLNKYVHQGKVNYRYFKTEEIKLDHYLRILEKTDSKNLSQNEQFAFYANDYNAWTIKLILSHYPDVKSIKNLGTFFNSPWKKKICRIDGELLTLDNIEHDILRPRFKDPRVHFAINCAAKSCPPLFPEPFMGSVLDRQLDRLTRAFINDSRHNYLEKNRLYVSAIFKWFAEDFNNDVIGFFLKYARKDFKAELEAKRDTLRIKYLTYDWSLNGS